VLSFTVNKLVCCTVASLSDVAVTCRLAEVQDVITQLRNQVNSAELQRQRIEQKFVPQSNVHSVLLYIMCSVLFPLRALLGLVAGLA